MKLRINTAQSPRWMGRGLATLAALGVLAGAETAQATIMVDAIVTPLAGSFRYDVRVTNQEAVELALVSLVDAPQADALIGATLTAPMGFLASYDSGLGIVDLLGDVAGFLPGSTTDGFSFESTTGPGSWFTTFEALDIGGTSFGGTIRTTMVPDAGSTMLSFGMAGGVLLGLMRRTRATC